MDDCIFLTGFETKPDRHGNHWRAYIIDPGLGVVWKSSVLVYTARDACLLARQMSDYFERKP